jgi:hypothetical protein
MAPTTTLTEQFGISFDSRYPPPPPPPPSYKQNKKKKKKKKKKSTHFTWSN